jgi:hypothetical protein
MGLTKRQAQAIEQIIIEESRSAAASQKERYRILDKIDGPPTVDAWVPGLTEAVRLAIVDLVEAFHRGNMVYEGAEFDNGHARTQALRYLRRLIENDVLEVQQMLQEGDFGMDDECVGMDQGMMGSLPMDQADDDDVVLPPMHPRGRKEDMKPAVEKPRGYPGDSDEPVDLPPMHPRGRR